MDDRYERFQLARENLGRGGEAVEDLVWWLPVIEISCPVGLFRSDRRVGGELAFELGNTGLP